MPPYIGRGTRDCRGSNNRDFFTRHFMLVHGSSAEILTPRLENHMIATIFKGQEQLVRKWQRFIETWFGHHQIDQQFLVWLQITVCMCETTGYKEVLDTGNQWMLAWNLHLRSWSSFLSLGRWAGQRLCDVDVTAASWPDHLISGLRIRKRKNRWLLACSHHGPISTFRSRNVHEFTDPGHVARWYAIPSCNFEHRLRPDKRIHWITRQQRRGCFFNFDHRFKLSPSWSCGSQIQIGGSERFQNHQLGSIRVCHRPIAASKNTSASRYE